MHALYTQGYDRFHLSLPHPGDDTWGKGRILVTTRDQHVIPGDNRFAKHYPILPMPLEDAVSLLQKASGFEEEGAAKVVNSHYVGKIPLDIVR